MSIAYSDTHLLLLHGFYAKRLDRLRDKRLELGVVKSHTSARMMFKYIHRKFLMQYKATL
jgi:hypothetical protein